MIIRDELTREEERDLIVRCRDDDQRAWNRLIEVHQSYIDALACRFWRYDRNNYYERDDYEAEAMYGFWISVMRFDLNRTNVRLATYSLHWINQRLRQMRKNRTVIMIPLSVSVGKNDNELPIGVSLDSEIYSDGTKTHASVLPDTRGIDSGEDSVAEKEIIQKLLDGMTPAFREAVMMKASQHSFADIGARLGVTRQRAAQIWAKALQILRAKMDRMIQNGSYTPPDNFDWRKVDLS